MLPLQPQAHASMGGIEITARLLAGVALILANGFFVAIEFGLTRARQYSKEEFMEAGLERAWNMTDRLEIYLTSCQVGITASSIAVGIVAEPALAALFAPVFGGTFLASVGAGAILAFLIINLLHLTHGEQTPTYLGVERSKQVCRYGATPLYYFAKAISPLIKLGDGVAKWTLSLFGVEMTGAWQETEADVIETRGDLHKELSSVLDESGLPKERRQEVMNALVVGDVPVRGIMVPREEIVVLSTTDSVAEIRETIEEYPHSRFPLVGENLEDFRGIIYLPSIVNRFEALTEGEIGIEDLATSPMRLPAHEEVSDAIDLFQAEHQELAFVEDQEGEIVGLLTATDAFEEVMGELEDPMDEITGSGRSERRSPESEPGFDPQGEPT
jgi:CBS domain containing-hemolysin-like protein